MKQYFYFACSVIAMLISGGCKHQQEKNLPASSYTIDIAKKQISGNAALEVVDAVKLQTTQKSLINQIAKIIRYDDHLFILTQVPQNNVLIFGMDGTFLAKIAKGRANNELFYPTDISVDESNGHLYVLDYYRTLKVFSLDGKFLKHSPLSDPQFNLESVGDDGSCVFYCLNMVSKNRFTGYYGKDKLTGIYKCPYTAQGYANLGYLSKFHQDSVLLAPFFSVPSTCLISGLPLLIRILYSIPEIRALIRPIVSDSAGVWKTIWNRSIRNIIIQGPRILFGRMVNYCSDSKTRMRPSISTILRRRR